MLRASTSREGERIARAADRGRRASVRCEGEYAFGAQLTLRAYRLENGLRVLVCPDPSAAVVSYMTWIDVGSRHEVRGKTGLAHLFEHLMFAGTEAHPPGDFDRIVESAGAESNAATWVDWTQYYENLPARSLPLAIELEADRLAHLRLDPEVVATEKEVVANERRHRVDDDVDGAAAELLFETAFRVHPYGRPTIGTMRDIRSLTHEDCAAFRSKHYVPNRITLVVVGDVDELDALAQIARAYGPLAAGASRVAGAQAEPEQRKERRVVLEKPTSSAKLALGYHAPAVDDARTPALSLANEILFGGRSSRAYRALVHDAELALEVSGSLSPFKEPGLYEMWATARAGVPPSRLERALDRILADALRRGFTEAELERCKNRFELSFLQGIETTSGKAEQIGFHAVVSGDPVRAYSSLEDCRRVTCAEARDALASVIDRRARTVVSVVPGGDA